MDEYIVLDPTNLMETANRTGIEFDTLRHLCGSAIARGNQYIVFKLNLIRPRWNGIEVPGSVSIEWVVQNISHLEE